MSFRNFFLLGTGIFLVLCFLFLFLILSKEGKQVPENWIQLTLIGSEKIIDPKTKEESYTMIYTYHIPETSPLTKTPIYLTLHKTPDQLLGTWTPVGLKKIDTGKYVMLNGKNKGIIQPPNEYGELILLQSSGSFEIHHVKRKEIEKISKLMQFKKTWDDIISAAQQERANF